MALDFIAPGNCSTSTGLAIPGGRSLEFLSAAASIHRGSRPVTPYSSHEPSSNFKTPFNSPELDQTKYFGAESPITSLPSPTWTVSGDPPQPHIKREASSAFYSDQSSDLDGFSSSSERPSKFQKRSRNSLPEFTPSARTERHAYDPEERYAIIYLRSVKDLKWEDVLRRFTILFPPATLRRCRSAVARGLPHIYQTRNVQGLQCRWYRIREEESLPQLRRDQQVEGGGSAEREVLDRIVRAGLLSKGFIKMVDAVGDIDKA